MKSLVVMRGRVPMPLGMYGRGLGNMGRLSPRVTKREMMMVLKCILLVVVGRFLVGVLVGIGLVVVDGLWYL